MLLQQDAKTIVLQSLQPKILVLRFQDCFYLYITIPLLSTVHSLSFSAHHQRRQQAKQDYMWMGHCNEYS
jgi:hypothetical protein